MNEKITNIWNNEELDNDGKLNALLNETKNFVPKARLDEYLERLKKLEEEKQTIQTEFDEFKISKMTADEKAEAEKSQLELDKKANARMKSELAVEKMLLKSGIEIAEDDTDLKETLQNIVSEDYEKSIKLANNFISLLNKTKDQTAKETTTQLLNDTPKPIGGVDSSTSVSKLDELQAELKTAIENKDVPLQTRLMTQIYQEQQKKII